MFAALIAIAVLLVPASAAAQDQPAPPAADGRWIVVYERGSVDSVDRETDARERRRGFRSRLRFKRAIEGFAAKLTEDQVRALRADPDVEAVLPDRPVHALAFEPLAAGEPLPPTGVRRMGAAGADWVRGSSDANVAVVDTGVDLAHPDLNVQDGTDCVSPGTTAADPDGHGTHVAGIIGARNDGAGVAGVAPGTRIQAVRVLNAQGIGTDSQVICGIDWAISKATERNIRVLNLSLGAKGGDNRNCGMSGSTLVDPLHAAICRATAAGLLSVVAAGNEARDISTANDFDLPAAYPEVLTVAAMTDADGAPGRLGTVCQDRGVDDTRARYSNFTLNQAEAAHTLAAPGTCITSTWPVAFTGPDYATLSGTSMATPHVAGLAALCLAEAGAPGPCAGMTPAQIVERLRADAAAFAQARPSAGFEGDPLNPIGTQYFGFLARPQGPDTGFISRPSSPTTDSTPTFDLSSSASPATFECRMDGGEWVACASSHTTGELPDGAHELAVRSADRAGTPDASPAAHSFTVDAVPDVPPPPPPPPPDTTAPEVSLALVTRQRIASVSRNGIRVGVTCTEACGLESRVVIAGKEALRLRIVRRTIDVTAGRKGAGVASTRRTLAIRLTSAVRKRLTSARTALVQVQVVATDAAGNARTVRKSVRLVR